MKERKSKEYVQDWWPGRVDHISRTRPVEEKNVVLYIMWRFRDFHRTDFQIGRLSVYWGEEKPVSYVNSKS